MHTPPATLPAAGGETAPKRRPHFLVALLWSLVLGNGLAVLVTLLGLIPWVNRGVWFMFIGIVAAIALGALGAEAYGTVVGVLGGLLALALCGLSLWWGTTLVRWAWHGEVELESVAAAPRHPDGVAFRVPDGRPQASMSEAIWHESGDRTTGWMLAVPVVAAGWDQSQPAPMWAICEAVSSNYSSTNPTKEALAELRDGCRGTWHDKKLRTAVIANPEFQDRYDEAVAMTAKQYGLTSAKGAPTVRWGDSWENEAGTDGFVVTVAYVGANGLWMVLSLASLLFGQYYRKRSRSAATAS